MAAAATAAASGGLLSSQAYLDGNSVKSTRPLVSGLCHQFYTLGCVSGTGGSIAIKIHDDAIPKPQQLVVMRPSGVQKERMMLKELYVLSGAGVVLSALEKKPNPNKLPKCTNCAPLFIKIIHTEMIKGIQGHGYYDELVVPIIENTAYEGELTEALSEITAYSKTTAVLVRNRGIYIGGDSWISAKTQAECHRYLLDAAIKLHQLGIDWTSPSHGPASNVKVHRGRERHLNGSVMASSLNGNYIAEPSRQCIVLDIEGTTTPISFVTDVLFPYARDNVRKHLMATYDSKETKEDIELLRAQVKDDLEQGVVGSVAIPPDDAGEEKVIDSLVTNVEAMINTDRKVTALKQLQGHIWRTGFENNELQGAVFEDVPEALEKWHANGIKVYIYSSGSREAQRLIFGNTSYGDLRKYLCGFFDTNVGNKRESRSYFEISQSVGVDKPSQVLFITDVYQEAVAAKAAGLEVIISVRPGNVPLPENHGFKTIRSFAEI